MERGIWLKFRLILKSGVRFSRQSSIERRSNRSARGMLYLVYVGTMYWPSAKLSLLYLIIMTINSSGPKTIDNTIIRDRVIIAPRTPNSKKMYKPEILLLVSFTVLQAFPFGHSTYDQIVNAVSFCKSLCPAAYNDQECPNVKIEGFVDIILY